VEQRQRDRIEVQGSADSSTALVAEGHRDEAAVLAAWLRRRTGRVVTAESGADAVSMARQVVPDWIFVDDALPDMSPVEVAHRLRSNADLRGARVVALVDDARSVAHAEFDRVLARPLHGEQLARLIEGGPEGAPG